MSNTNHKVGIITFTDDRERIFSQERERYLRSKQDELTELLKENGFIPVDPLKEIRKSSKGWYGIRFNSEVRQSAQILNQAGIECLIIGTWHWSPPQLVMDLVNLTNVPLLLVAEDNTDWAGSVFTSAVGATLLEWGVNRHALTHERSFLSDKVSIIKWVRGVCAAKQMRKSAAILWGGSYAVKMELLQDDIPRLKTFLIRDILSEGQYILIKRSQEILRQKPDRINSFIHWLKKNGTRILYDDKMLNEEILRIQLAYVLAARDRLEELKDEEITGVSIKCQPEIYEEFGVIGCTLPAFLPFSEDSEGKRPIIPTVCEGDIKGLLTCMLLHKIVPDVPPVFGDLRYICDDFVVIANCGAASIYWADNSLNSKEVLPNVTIQGNNHGRAGGAVGYWGKETEATVARLIRIRGKYYMHIGVGKALDAEKTIKEQLKKKGKLKSYFGLMWPQIVVNLGVRGDLMFKVAGANHLSMTEGDCSKELIYACRELAIPVVRIDSNEAILGFYETIRDLSRD